jgi:hypothetical protein
MTSTSVVLLILIPLILWRVYSRVRRLVGRQRSTLRRHWIALIVFPLLSAVFGLGAMASPYGLPALAGGLAIGAALGWWGLRLTRFEATSEGYFYTPNAHLGIALSLLFVGRILYRMVQMFGLSGVGAQAAAQGFSRSPFTLALFGTLAGYYTAYAAGMLIWRSRVRYERKQKAESAAVPTPAAAGEDQPGSR